MKLTIINSIPDNFLALSSKDLHEVFAGPTIMHLEGENKTPLFLSTLLHGNETTSFEVVKKVLASYSKLPRSLIIFFGNIEAAKQGLRQVPGEVDFNRIWSLGDTPYEMLAQEVVNYAKENHVMASIDIHNNTGRNPYYACINKLDPSYLNLAKAFSQNIVYFIRPCEVQSMAFAGICPAVTIEAGISGDKEGVEHTVTFVKDIIENYDPNQEELDSNEFNIYHTVARVLLDKTSEYDYEYSDESSSSISFIKHLDHLNFTELMPGKVLGLIKDNHIPLTVENEFNQNVLDDFFEAKDNKLLVKKSIIPSMLTKNLVVAMDDCLGYLMERINLHKQ